VRRFYRKRLNPLRDAPPRRISAFRRFADRLAYDRYTRPQRL